MILFTLILAWCCGMLTAENVLLQSWQWALLAGLSITSLIITHIFQQPGRIFAVLLLFEAGALFSSLPTPDPMDLPLSDMNDLGTPLTITGRIISPPELVDRTARFVIQTENARQGRMGPEFTVSGKIQVYTNAYQDFQYGDRVQLYGLPETPPEYEGFSYREYLARQQIHTLIYSREITPVSRSWFHPIRQVIFRFRHHAHSLLKSMLPDPEASLLSGILLGIEGGISDGMMKDFQKTGTAHIIAISGFNITLIASIFLHSLRRWLGMRAGLITAAVAIGIYTVFVGADAAVLRAALMAGVSLTARLIGRQNHAYSALAAAVFLMTLIDRSILHDAGFQLSAAATLGLLIYSQKLENWFKQAVENYLPGNSDSEPVTWFNEFFLMTTAAQLTTMPLTLAFFHQVPVVSLVANPIILPAQPPIMILGGLAVITGMIFRPAGQVIAWSVWPFLRLTTSAVSFFASIENGSLVFSGDPTFISILYYLFLAAVTWLFSRPGVPAAIRKLRIIPASAGLSLVGLFCILTWSEYFHRPDGMLHIVVFPSGETETLLIRSPGGRSVLIGCGESPVTIAEALGKQLPPLHEQIDWLLLGTADSGATAGCPGVVEKYELSHILTTRTQTSPAFRETALLIRDHEIPSCPMLPGILLDFHDGVTIEILGVGEKGAAYLIRYENFRMLLTQGTDTDLNQTLISHPDLREMTAMILPGGGNLAAAPPDDLHQINPGLVIICVEPGGTTLNPNVLNAMQSRTILRTDQSGWINLATDGRIWTVQTEHPPGTSH